jgi:hypothetical protein
VDGLVGPLTTACSPHAGVILTSLLAFTGLIRAPCTRGGEPHATRRHPGAVALPVCGVIPDA